MWNSSRSRTTFARQYIWHSLNLSAKQNTHFSSGVCLFSLSQGFVWTVCEGADRSTSGGWTQKTTHTWAWHSPLLLKSLVSTTPSLTHRLAPPSPLSQPVSFQVKPGQMLLCHSHVWTVERSLVRNVGHVLYQPKLNYVKSLSRWPLLYNWMLEDAFSVAVSLLFPTNIQLKKHHHFSEFIILSQWSILNIFVVLWAFPTSDLFFLSTSYCPLFYFQSQR